MNETDNAEHKKLSSIYHELSKLTGSIEYIQAKSNYLDLNYNLQLITQKIEQTQGQIIEKVVKDVIDVALPNSMKGIKQDINLVQAVALIKEIEKKAIHMGLSVVIAVYNSAARPIAVHCMDHAYIASFDVANNKAFTSAALKMSTSKLKNLSQPGQELYGVQYTNQGKIVIFGGGEPLIYNSKIYGAIGVSGGTEAEDTKLAEYGKNKYEEVVMW